MPTARQHTIILHGGSRGAKSSKTDIALKHYEDVLANRMKCIMAEAAKAVYAWQVPGTSIKDDHRPRWSGAFRANWFVKIAKYGETVMWPRDIAPLRYPWDWNPDNDHAGEYVGRIDPSRAENQLTAQRIQQMSLMDAICIGNVSPYAKWLNNGGELPGTYITEIHGWLNPGYHFMEQCIKDLWDGDRKYQFVQKGLAAAAKKPARG